MKADWEDASQHLKRTRQSAGRWVVAVTIGVAFTALAVYVADHKLPFPPEPQIAQAPSAESYTPKYEFNEPTGQPVTTPKQLFRGDVNERNRQRTQPKQTIYNDTNYVPKGATNVVDMETMRQSEACQNPVAKSSGSSRNSIELSCAWGNKWSGGVHYYAQWAAINNYRGDALTCANHKRWSIDYRERRMGVKQFFKNNVVLVRNDRTSNGGSLKRRYCYMASSFIPMG